MSLLLAVLLAIPVLLILWSIGVYNKLIKLRNLAEEAWSGIDVQLKRRADLIPNLVNTVKGYMDHERELLSKITELRAKTMGAAGFDERIKAEAALSRSLGNLFAVAENYPELKANQNFLDLQGKLAEIEDQIQMARRYYNGTVRNLNIGIESFPNSVIASRFGFKKREFFEIEDEGDRALPKVEFKIT